MKAEPDTQENSIFFSRYTEASVERILSPIKIRKPFSHYTEVSVPVAPVVSWFSVECHQSPSQRGQSRCQVKMCNLPLEDVRFSRQPSCTFTNLPFIYFDPSTSAHHTQRPSRVLIPERCRNKVMWSQAFTAEIKQKIVTNQQ